MGGSKRPPPRASLVLGGENINNRRKNGLNGSGSTATSNANNMMEQQRSAMANSRSYVNLVNGASHLDLLESKNDDDTQPHKLNNTESSSAEKKSNSKHGKYSSDLVVVLDMDECLIHSQFLSDQLVDKYRQVEDRPSSKGSAFGQKGNNNEEAESIIMTSCDSFRINLPDGDLVNVNKRPNLDLFLKEITSKFETYIFTAAMEVYAAPVLDELDPNGDMFRGRFYREHCVYNPDLGAFGKDLKDVLRMRKKMMIDDATTNGCFPCDERRVVLVDNNPLSFLPNPSNGILVSSFYDDPKDDTLEEVMELLHELDGSDDVRPILDNRFGLKDALEDVVRGASISW